MMRGLRKRLSAWMSLVLCLHLALSSTVSLAQPKAAPAKPGAPTKPAAPAAPAQPQDLIAKGQQLFEDQQYEDSVQTLSAALLRPSNTKEQKVEIYRLLALNYITLGRKDEADNAVRGLLVVQPDYQLPANESPRFRDFFKEARAKWEAEGRPGLVKEKPTEKPVALRHGSPSSGEKEKAIELHAKLEDPDGRTGSVKLYYRTGSRGDFTEAMAEVEGDSIRAQIPGSAVKPPLMDYYFEVLDGAGTVIASRGDAQAPLRIAIPDGGGSGWVLPVALGGGILGAAAIVGVLALAGVFESSSPPAGRGRSTVTVNVGESGFRF
ncbi:MAG: Tetratricopeptide repeat protein [Labilithrix sp.]|nr:Tetratricopeptide repeat protein [Labilithrix sp.]